MKFCLTLLYLLINEGYNKVKNVTHIYGEGQASILLNSLKLVQNKHF